MDSPFSSMIRINSADHHYARSLSFSVPTPNFPTVQALEPSDSSATSFTSSSPGFATSPATSDSTDLPEFEFFGDLKNYLPLGCLHSVLSCPTERERVWPDWE